ncbi:hypothetical protein SeLEV6574_g05096 [Synchytrium endobioticum]|uniref:Uncharacterized protein n=1 Tax=Synchytrium endobioticum TaxID=286115 RepID=A0A507CW42_9FUNG|nr:hypothetical protein SeLEV6574_g05096 [Synchytrium endobioticum]
MNSSVSAPTSKAISIPTRRTASHSSSSFSSSTKPSGSYSSTYSSSTSGKSTWKPTSTDFVSVNLIDNDRYLKLLSNSGGFRWDVSVLNPRYRDRPSHHDQSDIDDVPVTEIRLDDV